MINVSRAFNRHTTSKAYIQVEAEGHYDDDNLWVSGELSAPRPIMVTPRPYGDRDSGTYGERLEAGQIGERKPSFILIHTKATFDLGVNNFFSIYGSTYKVIRKGDYSGGGYYDWVGERVKDPNLVIVPPTGKRYSIGKRGIEIV